MNPYILVSGSALHWGSPTTIGGTATVGVAQPTYWPSVPEQHYHAPVPRGPLEGVEGVTFTLVAGACVLAHYRRHYFGP